MLDFIIEYFYPSSPPSSPRSSPSSPLLFEDDFIKTNPIFIQDLKNVKLKPPSSSSSPRFHPSVNIQSLSTKQLNDIKNVKLKKTFTNPTQTVFEIRHPCLRELLQRRLTKV